MNKHLRPILTLLFVLAYVGAGVGFVYLGKASGDQFLNTLAQLVGMVVAFWFGERAALKKPGSDHGG